MTPKWNPPAGIERAYEKALKQYARRLQRASNELLMPELPEIVYLARRYRPDALESSEEANEGSWVDQLNAILTNVLGAALGTKLANIFAGMKGSGSASDIGVNRFGDQVSEHNKRQMLRQVKTVYGERYRRAEPWLQDLLRAWELENLKLIRSIPERYVDDLQGTIIRAINEGQSVTDLRDTIRATYDQPVNRASLIARDQIGKLHSRLTQYRQESIGIKSYRWRGVMDLRERPHHRRREGDIIQWSKPPYDGHAGQPIGCRCWAQPVWPPRDEVRLE